MSVMYFSDKELSCIYAKLLSITNRNDSPLDISEEKLYRLINRLGLCNRFAYEINYLNGKTEIKLEIPNFETADFAEITLKKLIEKLTLLDYNCITNSGKCFVDEEDKELLEKILCSLKWRLIKALERNLKK